MMNEFASWLAALLMVISGFCGVVVFLALTWAWLT